MPRPETSRLAVHLTLRWRHDVLAVRRVEGEGVPIGSLAPIPCPAPLLGFVFARVRDGKPMAFAPAGGMVTVWRVEGGVELVEGPAEVPLAAGDVAQLSLGDFELTATPGAPETLARVQRRRAAAVWGVTLAALAHAVVLGLAAQDARASSAEDAEADRLDAVRHLLASAELRARAAEPPPGEDGKGAGEGREQSHARGDGRAGGGAQATGAEGKMGNPDARTGANRRYAVPAERKNDPSPSTARAEALADASEFGMIGLLAQGPEVPVTPFSDPWAHGADPLAARGSMWADNAGDAPGTMYGLGLTGIGEGGGGRGEGIGLGYVGTIGHTRGPAGSGLGGEGSPVRGGSGWSVGWGRIGYGHRAHPPIIRCGWGVGVDGRLPPEIIQRIIRQNHGRFRACYEPALLKNPSLAGRVTTRFVIGRDGAVTNVANGGADLPDASVVSCVTRAFYGLSFPQPEGGIVTVTYPITFSPAQ
jgi:hypothetical protein